MPTTNETTSLLCVFHYQDQANAALRDLQKAGVPQDAITTITGNDSRSQLSSYGMPERDEKLLDESLRSGATLLVVNATSQQVAAVEGIFGNHSAKLVDEYDRTDKVAEPAAVVSTAGAERSIPVVEEELAVGKRTVDQGGIKVFRRVVEIPVSESVNLREEHVVIDRKPMDRLATVADISNSNQSMELTETAEEVVLSKTAHVVEEVLINRESSDRVEHIQDTVRRTEVEVEELPSERLNQNSARNK